MKETRITASETTAKDVPRTSARSVIPTPSGHPPATVWSGPLSRTCRSSRTDAARLAARLAAAIHEMAIDGDEQWGRVLALAGQVRESLASDPRLEAYGNEIVDSPGIAGFDPAKVGKVGDTFGLHRSYLLGGQKPTARAARPTHSMIVSRFMKIRLATLGSQPQSFLQLLPGHSALENTMELLGVDVQR